MTSDKILAHWSWNIFFPLQYKLESFTEARSTMWTYEPYRGMFWNWWPALSGTLQTNFNEIWSKYWYFYVNITTTRNHNKTTKLHILWDTQQVSIIVTSRDRWGVSNQPQLDCFFEAQKKNPPRLRITGPLWGESTGDRWIPLTKGR